MAYHSFLLEPISCHAWNKDRTREYTWGTPKFPRDPQTLSWLNIPVAGDAPGRGRAGFGEADPATGRFGGWDSTSQCPPVPGWDRAWHGGASAASGPEAAAGREGRGAEPGDSRAMAFPEHGPGDVGEQKELSVLRPSAGQAGLDGAGFGSCAPPAVLFHPILSHPVLSQPTSSKGPRCREGMTLGWGVWGSPFP